MWEQYIVLHFPNCQKNCVQQLVIFILFRHFSPKSSVKFKSIYCSSTLTSNVQHVVSEFGVDPKLLGENCKKKTLNLHIFYLQEAVVVVVAMVVVVVEVVMEGAMATEVTEYKKIPDPYCCLILLKLIKSLLKFKNIFFCNPSHFLLFASKIQPHFNTFIIILVITKQFCLLITGSIKIPFYKTQKPHEKKMFSCTVKLFSFERLSLFHHFYCWILGIATTEKRAACPPRFSRPSAAEGWRRIASRQPLMDLQAPSVGPVES